MTQTESQKLNEDAAAKGRSLPATTIGDEELEIKLVFRSSALVDILHQIGLVCASLCHYRRSDKRAFKAQPAVLSMGGKCGGVSAIDFTTARSRRLDTPASRPVSPSTINRDSGQAARIARALVSGARDFQRPGQNRGREQHPEFGWFVRVRWRCGGVLRRSHDAVVRLTEKWGE